MQQVILIAYHWFITNFFHVLLALKEAKESSGFHKVSRLAEFLRQKLGFRYLGDITDNPERYWQPIQEIDDYFRFGNGQVVNFSRSTWLMLDGMLVDS